MPRAAAAADPKSLLIVVTGVNAATPPQLIDASLDVLMRGDVRVACAIDVTNESGAMVSPNLRLAGLFDRLQAEHPERFEVVAHVPGLWRDAAYFQLRRASEAQAALRQAFTSFAPVVATTVLSDAPESPVASYGGIRAAGFRTALVQSPGGRERGYGDTSAGVVPVLGGTELSAATASAVAGTIRSELAAADPGVVYVPLDHLAAVADVLAETVADSVAKGKAYSVLPSDIGRGAGGGRLVVLRVDAPEGADRLSAGDAGFLAMLQGQGIAASAGVPIGRAAGEQVAALLESSGAGSSVSAALAASLIENDDFGRDLARGLAEMSSAAAVPVDAVTVPGISAGILEQIGAAGVSIASLSGAGGSGFVGLDASGVVCLPAPLALNRDRAIDVLGSLIRHPRPEADLLVAVSADAVETPAAGEALAGILASLAETPGTTFASIDGYRASVIPSDPTFDLLKKSKAGLLTADTETGDVREADRAALLADAEIAWSYFKSQTDAKTGLVAATTTIEGDGKTTYPYMTMWDVGSLITGLVGAHATGIIDDGEFRERTRTALGSIKATKTGGMRLPRLLTSSDGKNPGQSGFDASDVGRLLSCLFVLQQYAGKKFDVAGMVAEWDIAKTLKDGRLHNVQGGTLIDVHDSSYTNYLARGYSNWGFEVAPIYPEVIGDSRTDAEMRVALRAGTLGSIGTEPHVLEEIELGYSVAAQTLANMLYTAQQTRYRETGRITCVSEGPLDRQPWFTYQGYRLGVTDDPWTVATLDNLARYQTPAFRLAVESVSSKAAFLWAAVRREPYSRTMVDYVRERGRTEILGYASGIYTETGLPTANYSDVNTNGIILSAIAYMLNGHRPLATQTAVRA